MIRIICDICKEEVTDQDFACDIKTVEIKTSLVGTELSPMKEREQKIVQVCRGCYYKHFSKLLNEKK